MIVDDEPYNLIAIEGLLILLGIEKIEKAFTGDEAIKKIESNLQLLHSKKSTSKSDPDCKNHTPYKLIIMNLNLPIINGAELAISV